MQSSQIMVLKKGKDVFAGTITFNGKSLTGVPTAPEYAVLISSILSDPLRINGAVISPKATPEKWINGLSVYYHSGYLRATQATGLKKFDWSEEDHPRADDGKFADGSGGERSATKAQLQKHLVDYKETRPLTGEGTAAISDLVNGARSVMYMEVPGVDKMHTLMGIPKPSLDTDPDEYTKARDRLFNAQPISTISFSDLTFTQKRVNTEDMVKIPPEFRDKPIQVVKAAGEYFLMNGHHRVMARHATGVSTLPGRVLDLDAKKFHATGFYEWRSYDFPGHAGRPGQVGGSLPRDAGEVSASTTESANSRDPKVLSKLAFQIEDELGVRERFDKIRTMLASGSQTKAVHFKDGKYTPERAALHEEIINGYLEGTHSVDEPTLFMLGGVSGSGKSSARSGMDLGNYVKIDADDIRAQLPEYRGWNAALTQDEVDDVTHELTKRAWSSNKNVLIDSTMKTYDKFKLTALAFKARGYNIKLTYVDAPLDKAMRNVVTRFGQTGRYVDLQYVASQDHKNKASFERLKSLAGDWSLFDASGPVGALKEKKVR